MTKRYQSRRRFLCGLSAGLVGSFAGCFGQSPDPRSNVSNNGTNSTETQELPPEDALGVSVERQFRGGLKNKATTIATLPSAVELAWALPTNRGDHTASKGSPIVTPAGNILIADDTGRIRLITPAGERQWETSFTDATRGSHGTPAVAHGTAYISAYDGAVSAIDVATGTIEWRTAIGAAIGASPTYHDGQLYVSVEHSDPSGSLAVLDADTGALREWDCWPTDHPHSTVAIDRTNERLLLGSNDGFCYCWEFPFGDRLWRYDTGGAVKTPVAIADGLAVIPSWAGTVTALDLADGTRQWEFQADNKLMCAPAVRDGTVYVGSHDTSVYAIDLATGDRRWEYQTGGAITGNAVATPQHVLVGSYDSHLYAIDQTDGSVTWAHELRGEVTSAPAVTADGIYITERAENGQSDYPGLLYKLTPA